MRKNEANFVFDRLEVGKGDTYILKKCAIINNRYSIFS